MKELSELPFRYNPTTKEKLETLGPFNFTKYYPQEEEIKLDNCKTI